MGELRPLYCVYCKQTLLNDDMEKCSGCGRVGGIADARDQAAITALLARKGMLPPQSIPSSGGRTPGWGKWRWKANLIAYGVSGIGLGIFFLAGAISWSDPRHFSLEDVLHGIVGILLGVALIVVAFLPSILARRAAKGGKGPDKPDAP